MAIVSLNLDHPRALPLRRAITRQGTTVLVGIAMLLIWQLVARVCFPRGDTLAAPTAILQALWADRQSWALNSAVTFGAAFIGLGIGTAIAFLLAATTVLVPPTSRTVLRVSVGFYSLPIVALGPILQVRFSFYVCSIVLATLAVLFTSLVAIASGLRSVPPGSSDITRGFGGTQEAYFWRVRIIAALPSVVVSLRVAFPGAVIGAMIGEFLGAPRGLGQLLVSYLSQFQTASTWATAVVITVLTTVGYRLIDLLSRPVLARIPPAQTTQEPKVDGWHRQAATSVGVLVLTGAIMLVIWIAYLHLFSISTFVGKTPTDVWRQLTAASAQRSALFAALGRTLEDTVGGLLLGWIAAVIVASVFVLVPTIERLLLPFVLGMRSVPIIAVLPALTLFFGRGLTGTLVIVAILVFVPCASLVLPGLQNVPGDLHLISRAYNASPIALLLKVRLPMALPVIFAALRVACPLAFIGALLAEWLASGEGLGYVMLSATTQSLYTTLWSATVLLTAVSVVAYACVDILDRFVTDRFQAAR